MLVTFSASYVRVSEIRDPVPSKKTPPDEFGDRDTSHNLEMTTFQLSDDGILNAFMQHLSHNRAREQKIATEQDSSELAHTKSDDRRRPSS